MSTTAPTPTLTLGANAILSTTIGTKDPIAGTITPADDPGIRLMVMQPDATIVTFTTTDNVLSVTHDATGEYHVEWEPPLVGYYRYRWVGDGDTQGASEGDFNVTSMFVARVSSPNDVRTLGPIVQRALEGVVQAGWTLTPDQVKDVTADAMSQILLYSGSIFGSQLNVTETDAVTLAPTEYATTTPLTLPESTVVAAQAALNYFYHQYKGIKISEEIGDEASKWSYSLSPALLIAQLNLLKDARDRALEALDAAQYNLEGYVSFLEVRDAATSLLIEPWRYGGSDSFGTGGVTGDPRFGIPVGGFFGIG